MSQGPLMGKTTAQPVGSGPAVQFRKQSGEGTPEEDRGGGPSAQCSNPASPRVAHRSKLSRRCPSQPKF